MIVEFPATMFIEDIYFTKLEKMICKFMKYSEKNHFIFTNVWLDFNTKKIKFFSYVDDSDRCEMVIQKFFDKHKILDVNIQKVDDKNWDFMISERRDIFNYLEKIGVDIHEMEL